MSTINVHMIAGLDIGNGYVKGKVKVDGHSPFRLDLPSAVSTISGVSSIPRDPESDMPDLVNNLDAEVVSRSISDKEHGRLFFGSRAVEYGTGLDMFDINNHIPKSEDPMSMQLILGCVASAAVMDTYKSDAGSFSAMQSDGLVVHAMLGVALPIDDYTTYRNEYATKLKNDTHFVIIHNFDHDIRVSVVFDDVVVLPEGAAGQYAIVSLENAHPGFLDMIIKQARDSGIAMPKELNGALAASATNTIGVDVGEGTVNFPVFRNGAISIESSGSINQGYGTVLERVVEDTRNSKFDMHTRKQLADYLLQDPNKLFPQKRNIYNRVKSTVDKEVEPFVKSVLRKFNQLFSMSGVNTDIIYVYGGGASAVRDALYPALASVAMLDKSDPEAAIPVLYMDSKSSRDLNRNGLFDAATSLADNEWNKSAKVKS